MAQLFTEESDNVKKPSRIGKAAKFLFDVPAWLGADFIKDSSNWLSSILKRVFFSGWGRGILHENFAQAMQRLNIAEKDLDKQAKNFFYSSLIFLGLGILTLFYLAYLWNRASFLVILAIVIVCFLFLIQSYFYSFWCLQIKRRQLGCSFRNWFNWILRGQL